MKTIGWMSMDYYLLFLKMYNMHVYVESLKVCRVLQSILSNRNGFVRDVNPAPNIKLVFSAVLIFCMSNLCSLKLNLAQI